MSHPSTPQHEAARRYVKTKAENVPGTLELSWGEYSTSTGINLVSQGRFTHSMPFPCRAHTIPLPCRAAKGLECVFPIWFTQCGRVWFTLAMPCPSHAPTMPFFSRPQHSTAVSWRPCCAVLCCAVLCVNRPLLVNNPGGSLMCSRRTGQQKFSSWESVHCCPAHYPFLIHLNNQSPHPSSSVYE